MKQFVSFLILLSVCLTGCKQTPSDAVGDSADTIRVVERETYVRPGQAIIDAYNQVHENIVMKGCQMQLTGDALRDSIVSGAERLKKIVELEPRYELAYSLLVQFQYALGQYDEMFATLDKAEEFLYDDPNISTLRACILVDMGRDEEADDAFQEAIAKEKALLEKGIDVNRDINLCIQNALLDSAYSMKDGLRSLLSNQEYNAAEKDHVNMLLETMDADDNFRFDRSEISANTIGRNLIDSMK